MDLGIIGLEFGLFAFLGGLWGIAAVILTAPNTYRLCHSGLPRRNPVRSRPNSDYSRACDMGYSDPHRRRNYSGYLLGNASLAPKPRHPYRPHRNYRNRRDISISKAIITTLT